ncbi:DUF3857 domain-containing transglutaminase family protein [Chromobacterium sp. IIBBL 290-4]|uniref:DUF3857 domain-containing transglutaminase family protein n=1 Tax=Chromobacterium sp. IIBBL 290-4 TaxID=2953890 RepID=UPI0020B8D5A8|nr:DUF3857 domain-containing protein [Chromobacterium sp. IIBBL 290-4]UTH76073.1 DUF3857 domain-containing protein [Chromobacterium sp. IIBBL 290-4]
MRFNRNTLSLACGLALACPAALAALQPVSEAPLALSQRTDCVHNADNSLDCDVSYQYTILKPAGKDQLTRIDLTYPVNDTLTIESGEVRQADGKVVKLDKSQVETRMAPNPYAGISHDKQTWLTFPELSVGSVVSYRFRHHIVSPPLSKELLYAFNAYIGPVRLDQLTLKLQSNRPLLWRGEQADNFAIESSDGGKKLQVALKKPHYQNYTNEWNNSDLRSWPRLSISTSDKLNDHLGIYSQRYREILAAPLPPAAAAAVEAAKGKPPAEQIAAFLQHINNRYRYLNDTRLAERGFIPFTLAEIEQHGYGDCKDLAFLLTAMLRAAGLPAEPALVFRGDFAPVPLLPGIGTVNHMIVRGTLGGKTLWLDPTNPFYLPGYTPSDIQDRPTYVYSADGAVRQETIPAEAPAPVVQVQRVETLRRDGSASIASDSMISGQQLVQVAVRDRYQGDSSSDTSMCNGIGNQPVNCQVQRAATAYQLQNGYNVQTRSDDARAVEKISGMYLYDPDLAYLWNHFASYRSNGNQGDVYLGDAEIVERSIWLKGARAVQPASSCQVNSPWFDLAVKQRNAADGIHLQYQLTRKTRWLSHDDLASDAFGKLIAQGRDCANSVRQILKL